MGWLSNNTLLWWPFWIKGFAATGGGILGNWGIASVFSPHGHGIAHRRGTGSHHYGGPRPVPGLAWRMPYGRRWMLPGLESSPSQSLSPIPPTDSCAHSCSDSAGAYPWQSVPRVMPIMWRLASANFLLQLKAPKWGWCTRWRWPSLDDLRSTLWLIRLTHRWGRGGRTPPANPPTGWAGQLTRPGRWRTVRSWIRRTKGRSRNSPRPWLKSITRCWGRPKGEEPVRPGGGAVPGPNIGHEGQGPGSWPPAVRGLVAVFVNFQGRFSRTLKFLNHILQPDGTFKAVEVPGPPSYDAWLSSWRVYENTLLMLEKDVGGNKVPVATVAAMEAYKDAFRDLVVCYPEAWHLLVVAEDRCRGEHFVRLRRELEVKHARGLTYDYDPEQPWNEVFRVASQDREFWDRHVREPALLFRTGGKHREQPGGTGSATDGTSQKSPPKKNRKSQKERLRAQLAKAREGKGATASEAPAQGGGGPPPVKGKGRGPKRDGRGRFLTDRQGKPICFGFNNGHGACMPGLPWLPPRKGLRESGEYMTGRPGGARGPSPWRWESPWPGATNGGRGCKRGPASLRRVVRRWCRAHEGSEPDRGSQDQSQDTTWRQIRAGHNSGWRVPANDGGWSPELEAHGSPMPDVHQSKTHWRARHSESPEIQGETRRLRWRPDRGSKHHNR